MSATNNLNSSRSNVNNCSPIYCILGGFLIGTGTILVLIELINDGSEWTLRIIGFISLLIGCILIFLYTKYAASQPLNNCSSTIVHNSKVIQPPTLKVKREGRFSEHNLSSSSSFNKHNNSNLTNKYDIPSLQTNSYNHHSALNPSSPGSASHQANHSTIDHYKPRHFAGHGNRPKPAPLACQEDITPSLRSSFNSLYLSEQDLDLDSDTSSINSMIYIP